MATMDFTNMSKEDVRAKAEELAGMRNSLYLEEKIGEAAKLDDSIEECVNEYTARARRECFISCKDSTDPMLEAIRRLQFKTIRAKDTKLPESEIHHVDIEDTLKYIDLKALDQFCGGIGKDVKWYFAIQKFNYLLTARAVKELIGDGDGAEARISSELQKLNDSYNMKEIAKSIELGEDLTSNSAILDSLKKVIAMMIGDEYKPLTHDVRYLKMVYTKKGKKALSVNCADHSHLTQYIADICHRIVTGGHYDVEYKTIKK